MASRSPPRRHSRTADQLSPALARLLLGPACGVDGPFVVAGTFVGESALDDPHTVSIDVDETDRPGRQYLGLVLTLLIGEETPGIKERDEFLRVASVTAKTRPLRATIECLAAARPDRGFSAVAVAAAPPCGGGAGVGVSYPYDLNTHCGVRYAYFATAGCGCSNRRRVHPVQEIRIASARMAGRA